MAQEHSQVTCARAKQVGKVSGEERTGAVRECGVSEIQAGNEEALHLRLGRDGVERGTYVFVFGNVFIDNDPCLGGDADGPDLFFAVNINAEHDGALVGPAREMGESQEVHRLVKLFYAVCHFESVSHTGQSTRSAN